MTSTRALGWLVTTIAAALCACGGYEAPSGRAVSLRGQAVVPSELRGDVWVFLFEQGSRELIGQLSPRYVTAVSADRREAGDGHFVLDPIEPNPYSLSGLLDGDRNFDPRVDVLSQPTAGDRVADATSLNFQPGEHAQVDLTLRRPILHEPPAFALASQDPLPPVLELSDAPAQVTTLELTWSALGYFDPSKGGFRVRLVDEDHDGQPDDQDGDGVPDLYPRLFLRFLPKPGQTVPLDRQGNPAEVLVPLLFNPGPYLALLGQSLQREVVADRLVAAIAPQARAVTYEPGRGFVTTTMDAIPVGEYELWAAAPPDQFWKLPNGLGPRTPSQAQRFTFVHARGR